MVMRGLCRDGSLEVCIFSFYLTGTSGSSYIDFGTIDTSIVTDPSETAWIDIEEADEWGNRLNGFRWGPEFKDKNEYSIPEDYALSMFLNGGTSSTVKTRMTCRVLIYCSVAIGSE